MSTEFPDVFLEQPYVAQVEYKSRQVHILQIDDSVNDRTLRAYVQLGDDPIFKYWVPIASGADYTVDWTNAQVTAAIENFFTPPNP